jgi:hypothetical protein
MVCNHYDGLMLRRVSRVSGRFYFLTELASHHFADFLPTLTFRESAPPHYCSVSHLIPVSH